MRASLLLFLTFITLGLFAWVNFSGFLLGITSLLVLVFSVITAGYPDTLLLFLLGARELRSSDEKVFFEAASQEAYKLSVSMPRLYFYNGTLERAFVFQTRGDVSLVLNKGLLNKASKDELRAICFELLIQVKKGMAPKRTKCMFALGFINWIVLSMVGIVSIIIPAKEFKKSLEWVVNFLLNPGLEVIHQLILGSSYFNRLQNHINEYPSEKILLNQVGLKLRKPQEYYSLPTRKLMELYAVSKSRQFQNIMALEFLPHEWDYLFRSSEIKGAK